ncbi:MAG: hypothetical protein ACPG47_11000, partial [Leucothrix sp.]
MTKKLILLLLVIEFITNLAIAETKFKTQTVAEIQGVPWGLAQLDSNTLIYTLRSGGVGLIN